jgi:DedD protein
MMSVRYTGEATMEGPALHDLERWKDKIEVRLDNRQVFFLFFGSALVACMLFVLGVLVGKRIESRGRADAPTIDDPLAVLDRFRTQSAAGADDALTFPGKLIVGAGGGAGRVKGGTIAREGREDRLTPRENRMAARPVLTAATPVTANAREGAINSAARPLESASTSTSTSKMKSAQLPLPPSGSRMPLAGAAAPAGGSGSSSTVAPEKPTAVPDVTARSAPGVSTRPVSLSPSPGENDRPRGHFLLQLTAFQDKGEAEAFARKFADKSAYVVATDLPGKGVWYRVRLGNFATRKEASSAKVNFEREHHVIAYVAGSGPSR